MTCTLCGGESAYIGTLGCMMWWRCVCCGYEFSHDRDDVVAAFGLSPDEEE